MRPWLLWAALIFIASFFPAAVYAGARSLWRTWRRRGVARSRARVHGLVLAVRHRAAYREATDTRRLRAFQGAGPQTPDGPDPGPGRVA